MSRMRGKVALISGGAEGIGAAVARLIIAEGGSVMLGDVPLEKAQELAAELGERAAACLLDVRDLHQWEAAVSATRGQFGKLTVLCNIAGISEPGNAPDGDLDVWHRTIDINLHGPFYGMRAAIPAMEASGEPCAIVNIGSMIALRPAAFVAAYSASKTGLRGLTQSVALDLAARGLYNRYKFSGADTPENIETNFAATHPMNRIGEPEEVARAVVFLASDDASFTTGCDFTVDGGGSIRS